MGAVVVGVVAVGVEAVHEALGQPGQLFGAVVGGQLGEVGFGVFAGQGVEEAGQVVGEAADHRDVFAAEPSGALGGGGGGQHGWQGFTGEPVPRAEVGGFADAAGGFGAADQRRVGDRMRQCAAKLCWGGLAGEMVDQPMFEGGQSAAYLFAVLQHRKALLGVQRVDIRVGHFLETHAPKLVAASDEKPRQGATETTVTQEI